MQTRALIVDDEPHIGRVIHDVLAAAGTESLALVNSADASEHLQKEKFGVILLDLQMPHPDGLELCRQARTSGLNRMTPIILMSDDQSTGATAKGFSAGASLFLYKPIDKKRLVALIRAMQGAIEHERRRFRRVALKMKVQIGLGQERWDCETIDVSLNGMLIAGPISLVSGTIIDFALDISPHARPIVGKGLVTRVSAPNQMGIQLAQLPMAENARLQDFLLPIIAREEGHRQAQPGLRSTISQKLSDPITTV